MITMRIFDLNKLDIVDLSFFVSLFLENKLRQINTDENKSEIDKKLIDKFFEDYQIPESKKEDYVLIKIDHSEPDTFFVRPLLKEDFKQLLQKASELKNFLKTVQ